jgi:hypothetical protein
MAQVTEWVKTGINTVRAGLLWDGNATIVTGKANMSLDVRAFSIVTSRGATSGAIKWANDATLNLTKDVNGTNLVAPGSNSVYWHVFAWHREYAIDGTNSDPVIAVLVGTPAASPSVPALTSYPGAVSLATVLVPAGTTATNSGTTITQTAPFTAGAGGEVVVRTATERDAGSWQESQRIYRLDTKTNEIYDGTSWSLASGVRLISTKSGTGASSIVFDGVFTSAFDNYLVVFSINRGSATNITPVLRSGGSDITAANHNGIAQIASGSSVSASTLTAQTSWAGLLATTVAGRLSGELKVFAPALADYTRVIAVSGAVTTTPNRVESTMTYTATTAVDGFRLAVPTGTVDYTVSVYGLAQ